MGLRLRQLGRLRLNVHQRLPPPPHGFDKVNAWARREPEFERRAAFALLATLAVHKKQKPDASFLDRLPLIEQAATDERNLEKKP